MGITHSNGTRRVPFEAHPLWPTSNGEAGPDQDRPLFVGTLRCGAVAFLAVVGMHEARERARPVCMPLPSMAHLGGYTRDIATLSEGETS